MTGSTTRGLSDTGIRHGGCGNGLAGASRDQRCVCMRVRDNRRPPAVSIPWRLRRRDVSSDLTLAANAWPPAMATGIYMYVRQLLQGS